MKNERRISDLIDDIGSLMLSQLGNLDEVASKYF